MKTLSVAIQPSAEATRALSANLNAAVTDFDRTNGVQMVSPNNWQSPKHKLFGFGTVRQLRNAINRKLS